MGNTYRAGPQTSAPRPPILAGSSLVRAASVYTDGNVGPVGEDSSVHLLPPPRRGEVTGPEAVRLTEPVPIPPAAVVPAESAASAYRQVLARAGAWPRDEEDLRLLGEVESGDGRLGGVGERWREFYPELKREAGPDEEKPGAGPPVDGVEPRR